ncbi:ATP-dependent nuclease [Pedobacter sp. 22226]|uniref:ATP-dependent nuclease n=1 Tax=Pedobacter sp. 22226 TaxID=3453894 RepID=UPI003F853D75
MNNLRLYQNKAETEFYSGGKPLYFLENIERVNIIVGANNSRKSRFSRNIIKQESKVIFEFEASLNDIYHEILILLDELSVKKDAGKKLLSIDPKRSGKSDEIYEELTSYFAQSTGNSYELGWHEITTSLKNISESLMAVGEDGNFNTLKIIIRRFSTALTYVRTIYEYFQSTGGKFMFGSAVGITGVNYNVPKVNPGNVIPDVDATLDLIGRIIIPIAALRDIEAKFYPNQPMIYIPVLRTSRMLSGGDRDVFSKTIIDQYFRTEIPGLSIETGLDLYEKIQFARNGTKAQRNGFTAFENFISESFFAGKELDIVAQQSKAHSTDRDIRITIEDEREDIAVYDLGDGIQGVINLLFPVFTAQPGTWVFIDEPENHLHPGFQNIFMRAITENPEIIGKNLRIFISTHSNHILSEALLGKQKCEILVFNKRDKDSSSVMNLDGNEYSVLEMLGVFNTSVLISNCTLWVEGVTDRLYLRAFLYAYVKELATKTINPVEGMHYSFIEYAGTNLIHYNFDYDSVDESEDDTMKKIKAYFINTNIFLLADSDFDPEKHKKYEQIKRDNFTYHQTGLPEIENLLPKAILRKWLIDIFSCDPAEVDSCLNEEIGDQKLGKYFSEKMMFKNKKRYRKFEGPGGTLRSDLKDSLADFTHRAITDGTFSWEDLQKSPGIGEMMPLIYRFIEKNNRLR